MTAMPKLTLKEMGETSMIMRQVDMWSAGGDMRAIAGDDPTPPASRLERAAIIAFDVALQGESNGGRDVGRGGHSDRANLIEVLSTSLRLAIVNERQNETAANGPDGRNDLDRARLILVSMASVLMMRDRADGFDPDPLDNPILQSMRLHSGIDPTAFDRKDAGGVGVGMGDMVEGAEARRQLSEGLARSLTPSSDLDVEVRIEMAEATWPDVRPREMVQSPVSARSFDASGPSGAVQREAMDRAARSSGR